MVDLCIYHSNCMDGFTSAWAVKRRHPEVELLMAKYGDMPPYVEGLDVAIVDFSYSYETMADMATVANSLLVLDHHESAYDAVHKLNKNFENVIVEFDMERSGAGITWEWFHGKDTNLPMLIELVQDRDLWKFKSHGSKQLHAYLTSIPYDMREWDEVYNELETKGSLAPLFMVGGGIMRMQLRQIKRLIADMAFRTQMFGEEVWCLDCPKVWQSEAGNIMSTKDGEPFAVLFSIEGDLVKFSLRSSQVGLDVQALAKKFGGGGHVHAAGFVCKRDQIQFTNLAADSISDSPVQYLYL